MFCEFLIGLHAVLRLVIICSCHLFLKSNKISLKNQKIINEHLQEIERCNQDAWESLRQCKRAIIFIQSIAFVGKSLTLTQNEMEEQWSHLRDLIFENYALNAAFQNLCSLRYVPSGENRQYLSLAQILHWKGFGGEGEFLPKENDKYVEELMFFTDLSIRYHKKEQSHFGGHHVLQNMFIPIIISVQNDYSKFLKAMGKLIHDKQQIIKALDLGSGPTAQGIHPLLGNSDWKTFLVASDIDPYSIKHLTHTSHINETMFLDLNFIDKWENIREAHKYLNFFDIITARLVIHQLADLENGLDIYIPLLRFLSDVLTDGGVFCWFDTGPLCYMQGPVIPGNLVDREGCVPINIYPFIKEKDLKSISIQVDENHFKLLLMIPQYVFQSPQVFNLYGGLYVLKTYVNVTLSVQEIDTLQDLLNTGIEVDFYNEIENLLKEKHKEIWDKIQNLLYDE